MIITKEEKDFCDAIDIFADRMKAKMIYKRRKHGYRGWDDAVNFKEAIQNSFERHMARQIKDGGQEVDVANLAMMLYFFRNKKEKHGTILHRTTKVCSHKRKHT